jgi:cysteinyl-tRNA synthetase
VHHTNEIAQSETALDVHPWVQVWMHEEFLDFRGEKMSKSTGNVAMLQDLVDQGLLPLSYRYFFLQAHYRKQQTFTDEAIVAADRGYRRLLATTLPLAGASGEPDAARCAPWRERFRAAVRDDLNAPRALAIAIEMLRDEALRDADRRALLAEFDAFLGLDLLTAEPPVEAQESDPRIDALVAERQGARERRDFAEADRLRDALAAEGIVVEDTPQGSRWKRGPRSEGLSSEAPGSLRARPAVRLKRCWGCWGARRRSRATRSPRGSAPARLAIRRQVPGGNGCDRSCYSRPCS